jgi:hypothetical protein
MADDAFPANSGPANSLRRTSTARIGAHPIHPMLVPVPIACSGSPADCRRRRQHRLARDRN